MLILILVVLMIAAVIKAVFALCGHAITWRLAILMTVVLGILPLYFLH